MQKEIDLVMIDILEQILETHSKKELNLFKLCGREIMLEAIN